MENVKLVPLVLLSVYILNSLVRGAQLQDAVIIVALSAVSAFFFHKEQRKEIIQVNKTIEDQSRLIKEYTEKHDALKMKVEGSLLARNLGKAF